MIKYEKEGGVFIKFCATNIYSFSYAAAVCSTIVYVHGAQKESGNEFSKHIYLEIGESLTFRTGQCSRCHSAPISIRRPGCCPWIRPLTPKLGYQKRKRTSWNLRQTPVTEKTRKNGKMETVFAAKPREVHCPFLPGRRVFFFLRNFSSLRKLRFSSSSCTFFSCLPKRVPLYDRSCLIREMNSFLVTMRTKLLLLTATFFINNCAKKGRKNETRVKVRLGLRRQVRKQIIAIVTEMEENI